MKRKTFFTAFTLILVTPKLLIAKLKRKNSRCIYAKAGDVKIPIKGIILHPVKEIGPEYDRIRSLGTVKT